MRTLNSLIATQKARRTFNPHLSARRMHDALRSDLENPEYCFRAGIYREWYAGAHVSILTVNNRQLAAQGLSLEQCLTNIAGGVPRPWNSKTVDKQKRTLQKFVTRSICSLQPQLGEEHVRHRLARFMDPDAPRPSDTISHNFLIPGVPLHVARRVFTNFKRLPKLVPPRVCSAVWRCIFNSWCTKRRFQQRSSATNTCCLGCGGAAEDSIEHYSRCQIVKDILYTKFRIDLHPRRGLATFCMAAPEQHSDDVLALTTLVVYGVYQATNFYRHNDTRNPTAGKNSVIQHIIQDCQGHDQLAKLVPSRWDSPLLFIQ